MLSAVGEDQNGRMLLAVQVVQVVRVVEDEAYSLLLLQTRRPKLPLVLVVYAQLAGAPSPQHVATYLSRHLHLPRESWRCLVYVIPVVLLTGVLILCWRLPLLRSTFEE
jgi:hypothetical protein